jgi:polysaccharide export outer membrane protein
MNESLRSHRSRASLLALTLAAGAAMAACGPRGRFVPAARYAAPAADPEYRIMPGDVLGVRILNQDSMSNGHVRVRDDGKISLALVQDVEAAGLTPSELGQRLQTMMKAYVLSPSVTVTVEESRPLQVSVLGQVARPGQYEVARGSGLLAAIAAAGGLTEFANRDGLFVLRDEGGANKPPIRIRFRYGDLTRAEAPTFRLRSGDVVVAE